MTLYRHIANTDVAFKLIHRRLVGDSYKYKAVWFNVVNPRNIYPIQSDAFLIKIADLPNWKRIKYA